LAGEFTGAGAGKLAEFEDDEVVGSGSACWGNGPQRHEGQQRRPLQLMRNWQRSRRLASTEPDQPAPGGPIWSRSGTTVELHICTGYGDITIHHSNLPLTPEDLRPADVVAIRTATVSRADANSAGLTIAA
jgi:hypothetical protein